MKLRAAWRVKLLFAITLSFAIVFPSAAIALESDENLVDPTQRADNSFIYDTTIESLFDEPLLYDNRTVQIAGEVIGDRIKAPDNSCWITLSTTGAENKTTISVLMSNELANQIDRYGKYGVTGTIMQARGTYHQACDDHEGVPDIHATDASVMSKGVDHPDAFRLADFAPGAIAVVIGLALMAAFNFARERMR